MWNFMEKTIRARRCMRRKSAPTHGSRESIGQFRSEGTPPDAACSPSMSSRGSCFDNAVMKLFFSSLRREPVHLETFRTKAQALGSVFEYFEIFYNRQTSILP
jgi:hypothetical protein